jgi:lipopolysaccharide/colanic/teichoic acid biosynthesis glycosyltransferase
MRRLADVACGGVLLVLLSPMILAAAACVWLTLGKPILFRHRRVGYRGRTFTLIKFRTMRCGDADETDELRLTRVGRVLRGLSLDELPELWNVLRGDMSLVGPRPLLPEYLARYTSEQARRHLVLPGVTGLAQVSGRNGLTWEERFALDVWYVDHRSLRLDLWILWRTLVTVLRRDGVNAPGHATMPEFLGSR